MTIVRKHLLRGKLEMIVLKFKENSERSLKMLVKSLKNISEAVHFQSETLIKNKLFHNFFIQEFLFFLGTHTSRNTSSGYSRPNVAGLLKRPAVMPQCLRKYVMPHTTTTTFYDYTYFKERK